MLIADILVSLLENSLSETIALFFYIIEPLFSGGMMSMMVKSEKFQKK